MTPLFLFALLVFYSLVAYASWSLLLRIANDDGLPRKRKRSRLSILGLAGSVAAMILLVPSLALAASQPVITGGNPADWKTWVYTAVVVPFLGRAWQWLSSHVGIKRASEALHLDELWDKVGDDAIDFAEELAHRAAKEGKSKLDGVAKKNKAVASAIEYAKRRGLKIPKAWQSRAQEYLADLIDRRLGARRSRA